MFRVFIFQGAFPSFWCGSPNREFCLAISEDLAKHNRPHIVTYDGLVCRIFRGVRSPLSVITEYGRIYR